MFLMFAPPKASPVLYKAVVYIPTGVPTGVETRRYMPEPIDNKPTVIFGAIFSKITTIRANIDASIVEVYLNNEKSNNEKSYLFYGDVITPKSKSISYDNVVRMKSHAKFYSISRVSTWTVENTCAAIRAVFGPNKKTTF